jgi:hypothetical protein
MSSSELNTGLEVIEREECLELLRSENVGRLAVVVGGRPEIFPVNFVLDGSDVVIRTDEGTKLSAAVGAAVAFEVDHVDGASWSGWSVVVHGRGQLADHRPARRGSPAARPRPWRRAVLAYTVRIVADSVTGRRIPARPGDASGIG